MPMGITQWEEGEKRMVEKAQLNKCMSQVLWVRGDGTQSISRGIILIGGRTCLYL